MTRSGSSVRMVRGWTISCLRGPGCDNTGKPGLIQMMRPPSASADRMMITTSRNLLPCMLLSPLSDILLYPLDDLLGCLHPVEPCARFNKDGRGIHRFKSRDGGLYRLRVCSAGDLPDKPPAEAVALLRVRRLLPSPEHLLLLALGLETDKVPASASGPAWTGLRIQLEHIDSHVLAGAGVEAQEDRRARGIRDRSPFVE